MSTGDKHRSGEAVDKVIVFLTAAETALEEAAKILKEQTKDETLCTNCRLDATMEFSVIVSAGLLADEIRRKLLGGMPDELLARLSGNVVQ